MIYICLGKGGTLPQFHLQDIQARSSIFLLKDETGHINNLTGKYIMKLSKLKHIKRYMTTFELYCINFECLPKRQQLSTIFNYTIEEVSETLKIVYVDMSTAHSMIEPIVNRNFGNTFHHQNGPNQCRHINKKIVNSINIEPINFQRPHQLHN